jgi:hypothetical protein
MTEDFRDLLFFGLLLLMLIWYLDSDHEKKTMFFVVGIVLLLFVSDIPQCNNNVVKEKMTLKIDCDERDRNCVISCTSKEGQFNRKCFDVCKMNSPIC